MIFTIDGKAIKACFEKLSDKTLRLAILPVGEAVDHVFSTHDLAEGEWGKSCIEISNFDLEEVIRIGCFEINFEIKPIRFKISRNGKLVQTISVCEKKGYISFPTGSCPLFGLGHGYKKHMDRRGEVYDLRINGQVRGIIENYSVTSPTPYVISTEGWALYFHQPWKGIIDLRDEIGTFIKKPYHYSDIFIVSCDEPADAAKEYYKFTGLPPMPPKYAFGYQQSYRTLVHKVKNYVLETARYMRENEIPCDVLIYLGTGYCEYGWNTHNGEFQWHPDVFPNPKGTMQELHDMNYKISLHITKCYPTLHGSVTDTEEVSPLEYDHAKNYWKLHEELYETAKNEAWWPDDGDEIDIIPLLTRHRMYYEGSLQLNPDVRPFQMQRNTFPGANKWGGIIWSGDVLAEWETLKNQIPIGLNVALSSTPFWGTDTGGFFCTAEFDGELFMRWVQYSTFTPFFRCHGRPSFLHNPWGWTMFQSLDEIPLELAPGMLRDARPPKDALPDKRVEPLCKKYINLRYELLPYIYNLSYQACQGMPMMRPMWFKYPDDKIAIETDNQYFFGDSFLVAPVTSKGTNEWRVYLPEGDWYDYWTNTCYSGNQYVTVPAPYDIIPLFVPAGAIIPKAPVVQYVDTTPTNDFDPLEIVVYSGADGSYELYEDDGISLGYQRGEYTITQFNWDDAAQTMHVSGRSTMFQGRTREIDLVIMPSGKRESVTIRYT
jgi:alpha-glucosidase (family GH31 glycosyl hydrolase)